MITIKDKDFEMEQVKSTPFFNLKLPKIVNEGKDTERTELKIEGYGMPFELCIQKIALYRMASSDETYTVSEFMTVYKSYVDEILKLTNYVPDPPKQTKKTALDSEEEIDEEKQEETSDQIDEILDD